MNRILAVAATTLALATVTLSPSPALAAVHLVSPVHASFANSGSVRFSLRNDSSAPIDLHVGDNTMTLAPGKPLKVELPVGTRITLAAALGNRPAGDLVTQVSDALKGNTIILR